MFSAEFSLCMSAVREGTPGAALREALPHEVIRSGDASDEDIKAALNAQYHPPVTLGLPHTL